MSKKYHLFEVFGIELEYMLIHNTNFNVLPIVDKLLTKKTGELTSDVENGSIAWSNELVSHVLELKTNGPTADLDHLPEQFYKNVREINQLLTSFDAKLLSSASHPLMNPLTETVIWKHSYSEVYELYNRIFDCKGHGWSNVQSTHINLPFYDDKEFNQLHAAIRLVLPLIPGLCASSPILEGNETGFKDTRLEYYKTNQKEIPSMTGLVIPESVNSKADYYETIFEPIQKAIKPFDSENILDHHFLNSRGAIARFDRNAIEIRLVDIQECPSADIAICVLIIEVLKQLVNESWSKISEQKKWSKEVLFPILNDAIKYGEESVVLDKEFLALFGIIESKSIQDVWAELFEKVKGNINKKHHSAIENILQNGTLSTRILKSVGKELNKASIVSTYNKLSTCLEKNEIFKP